MTENNETPATQAAKNLTSVWIFVAATFVALGSSFAFRADNDLLGFIALGAALVLIVAGAITLGATIRAKR